MPKLKINHVCKRCGKLLDTTDVTVKYCDACKAYRESTKMMRRKVCMDCGVEFVGYPISKRCPDCAKKANNESVKKSKIAQRAGTARKIGNAYPCAMCGKEYTLVSANQKYCPDCRDAAYKEVDRACTKRWRSQEGNMDKIYASRHRARVCVICGKPITSKHATVTCGNPECIKARRREWYKEMKARKGLVEFDPNYTVTRIYNRRNKADNENDDG